MVSIAFIGCGEITKRISKLISTISKDINRYYSSRSVEKAKHYNAKLNGIGYFESYDDAINSSKIDVIYIATPPYLHYAIAKQALEHNKHVIVEKPPFQTIEEFDQIAELARTKNKQLIIAENYHYKPSVCLLRRLLSDNVIGEVRCIYLNAMKIKKIEGDWRDDPEYCIGGALYEDGIHWIHMLNTLGLQVKGSRTFFAGTSKSKDKSSITIFEYEGHALGSLFFSWENPGFLGRLRISKIFGTKGTITFESNGLFCFVNGTKKRIYFANIFDIDGRKAMLLDFFKSLRSNTEPAMNLELARQSLNIILESYRHLRT